MVDVLVVVAGYLLGCFPTAALVARRTGHDPAAEGSGNPGATNVYRVAGPRAGALVLAGDLAKGVAAATLGRAIGGRDLAVAAGAAAVVGHIIPVTQRGRGGKGVATAFGMAAVAEPFVAAAAGAVWVLVAAVSRFSSLASLLAMVTLPVGAAVAGRPVAEIVALAAVAALIGVRHRANIARLARGEERRLAYGRRR